MTALEYVLGNFWHFLGFIIILIISGSIIVGVIKAIVGPGSVNLNLNEEDKKPEDR